MEIMWEKDETVNHIKSECSKEIQKENKIKKTWEGKLTKWKLCKILEFNRIAPNSIITNLNNYLRMRHTRFTGILRFTRII